MQEIKKNDWSRREFLLGLLGISLLPILPSCRKIPILPSDRQGKLMAETFIAKAEEYSVDIKSIILSGLKELGVYGSEIKGKRILLKPNLVEPHQGAGHINTHPLIVQGAIEAFYSLGAAQVMVGEGQGHIHDTQQVIEESRFIDILGENRVLFKDFNNDQVITVPNAGQKTDLKTLIFPSALKKVDWIVSMAKMKTHHWAGVTLSMKNLFGVMPGNYYGWPKNVLHFVGIDKAIFDINMTLKPHFAIIDGIVGMEGDGPIMGTPKKAGVIILGRNLPAVDATAARIMGINPSKITYLTMAENLLGPIREMDIRQIGEKIVSVRTDFKLLEKIPAHRGLRS